MKVLFLTNVPSPYRVLFFQELGKKCDLTVLYEVNRATDRDEKWVATVTEEKSYKEIFLRAVRVGADTAYCPEVIDYLKGDYDRIIVGGYSTPTARYAIRYMKKNRIAYWLNCDGGFAKPENVLKRKIKTFYISGATGYLSTGKGADEYLMHYGAKPEAIYRYPFTSILAQNVLSKNLTKDEKASLRERLLPEFKDKKYVVITVGQMIPRKGIDLLLQAAKDLSHDIGYCIVGGEPPKEYRRCVTDYQLDNVVFVPFQKYEVLKDYYRAADLFVLPTREDIWGLVVNEAMANGLPVVTTNRCLAGIELVENGRNGEIIPVEDISALKAAIKKYVTMSEEKLEKQSAYALDVIQSYTIEQMAQKHLEIFGKKRVLYVGSVVSEDVLMQTRTTSAAANRFQAKLLKHIRQAGMSVKSISYLAEATSTSDDDCITKVKPGIYGILKVVRELKRCIEDEILQADMVICYNMIYAWLLLPKIARKYHKKMVVILADYSSTESYRNPLKKLYAKLQLKAIRNCNVVVGLSKQLQHYLKPSQTFLLMEGGIDSEVLEAYASQDSENAWRQQADGKPVLVYSGLLNEVAGIHLLLEALKNIPDDFVLYITGRGEWQNQVEEIAKQDSRVHYLGLLEEEDYLQVLGAADVLINPRNMQLPENQYNFPSKIMDYLATGNPILSTKFSGYEKFADVIEFCDADAGSIGQGLQKMLKHLKENEDKIKERRTFAKQFLWDEQVKRILECE